MSKKEKDLMASSSMEQAPLVSPGRDLRKLRKSGAASAGELKAVLAQMKGKSAGEVLGKLATSDLGKSLVTATAGAALLIGVFTVVPYALGKIKGEKAPVAAASNDGGARAKEAARAEGDPAETAAGDTAKAAAADGVDLSNGAATVEKLGVGEALEAPMNVNPLEGATDDLLKDLD